MPLFLHEFGDAISRFSRSLALVTLCSLSPKAWPDTSRPGIEQVCSHAMGMSMESHRDQFLVDPLADLADHPELDWLISASEAQWLAELNQQCIEGLIPVRRELTLTGHDAIYGRFAECTLATTEIDSINHCFIALQTEQATTPEGAALRLQAEVNQIRNAELSYGVLTGSYLPIPALVPDESPGPEARPWPQGGPFDVLGWTPEEGEVWGSYRVETIGDDDFKVIGIGDIDGDGVHAMWTATKLVEATQQTDPSIH